MRFAIIRNRIDILTHVKKALYLHLKICRFLLYLTKKKKRKEVSIRIIILNRFFEQKKKVTAERILTADLSFSSSISNLKHKVHFYCRKETYFHEKYPSITIIFHVFFSLYPFHMALLWYSHDSRIKYNFNTNILTYVIFIFWIKQKIS